MWATRSRFLSTACKSSPQLRPRLSEAKRPLETPPQRVVKPWRTPMACKSGANRTLSCRGSGCQLGSTDGVDGWLTGGEEEDMSGGLYHGTGCEQDSASVQGKRGPCSRPRSRDRTLRKSSGGGDENRRRSLVIG
jgi:hypothetical protein